MEEQIEQVVEAVLNVQEDPYQLYVDYADANNQDEGVLMSFSAAIEHIAGIEDKRLLIHEPVTQEHFDHIEQLISVWDNKRVLISFVDLDPIMVEKQIRFAISKSHVIDRNCIAFSYHKGAYYGPTADSEKLDIENRFTRLGVEILSEGAIPNILYNQMVSHIALLKNRNLLIDIDLQSVDPGFEKLFVDLGWTFDAKMAAWNNRVGSRDTLMSFEGDNNEYCLSYFDLDENVEPMEVTSESGYSTENIYF